MRKAGPLCELPVITRAVAFCVLLTLSRAVPGSEGMTIKQEDFPVRAGITIEYTLKSKLKELDGDILKHVYTDAGEIGGTRFVKRVLTMSDGATTTHYFYRTAEGVVRVPAMSSSEKSLVLKMPLKVGVSWEQKDYVGTRTIITKKVAETIETISTPLGRLKCIKVRQRKPGATDTDEDSFVWVAPKYGIVKIEINKESRGGVLLRTVITISKFEEKRPNGQSDRNSSISDEKKKED